MHFVISTGLMILKTEAVGGIDGGEVSVSADHCVLVVARIVYVARTELTLKKHRPMS